uniref:Uncharacterized protein n=1 Tax=Lotus japonicus TaxID=34305 RepID=I3SIF5_LOTJA|nr:unknown [Lotus japonicus]
MDSSETLSQHAKVVTKQCDIFPAGKYLSSRRTQSFSSSCSSLSPSTSSFESIYFNEDPLLSPASPLIRLSGVPFSWEHLPGIPKKQNSKKKQDSSMKLLPLPPPTTTSQHSSKRTTHEETWKKNSTKSVFQRDPFFAAMVECSKDDDDQEEITSGNLWNGAKVSRSVSDRFGFFSLYGSCKRTCAVSESLVFLPSSRRSTYQHVTRRSL